MPTPDDPLIPRLDTDPRSREELAHWRERMDKMYPGEPLTAREELMVRGLQNKRKPYSEM